jgi:deoxycytidylate deaminase
MQRIESSKISEIKPYFEEAAKTAEQAKCLRAHCGTVIVKNSVILGRGFNGPPLDKESNRTCNDSWDYRKRPKYDKTCCIHAEWRAILDACKKYGEDVVGSRLYFMRVDDKGDFTDAGEPFCTVCSRLTMETGIAEFVLWNNNGADIYSAAEYDKQSYGFYRLANGLNARRRRRRHRRRRWHRRRLDFVRGMVPDLVIRDEEAR